ncbi:ceramide-1-phosphate transfer protein-like isoform X2 [Gigantopelta aegis]|nr:ceramide-1-phosphate transfer protein-like isoform X2 [Gigantopelta aegis]
MSKFDTKEKHDFDLEVVLDAFRRCHADDNTLLMSEYLRAYTELCRFFKLMGTLFGFVARDIEDKVQILSAHCSSDVGDKYNTIQSMIAFEVENDITQRKRPLASGSRTLLRLHRALEFIMAFMDRIRLSDENEKASSIASEVYTQTLAKHHPWIVQKISLVAMYMLPSKKTFIDVMCKHDYANVMTMLSDVICEGKPIYDITQELYEKNGLLDLP